MKIVVLEPLGISKEEEMQASEKIRNEGHEVVFCPTKTDDLAELEKRGKDADAIIIANMPFKKNIIEKCKKLKFLSVAFAGVDHVDVDFCKAKGIMVCNAAGYSKNSVPELVFGLAISVLRNIPQCDYQARNGGTKVGLVGTELFGKKFGVVGTGAIGSRVCEIAQAFGCEVLAYSRTKKEELISKGIKYVPLNTLLKVCDIISLHVPYNKTTDKLIDDEKIAMMKKTAVLINTARGGVVDSEALAFALNEGRIKGAGIDVLEMEPPFPKDHVLLQAKNTVFTPHAAFASEEALYKRAEIVFDNIELWEKGTPQNICG